MAVLASAQSVSALPVPASAGVLSAYDVAAGSAQRVSTKAWLAGMGGALRKAVAGRAAQSRIVFAGFPGRVIVSRAAVFSSAAGASRWSSALERSATASVESLALNVPRARLSSVVRVSWRTGAVVGQLAYIPASGESHTALLAGLRSRLKARVRGLASETSIEALLARIVSPAGKVNMRAALQAFAGTIGPVPGVRRPAGHTGTVGDVTSLMAVVLLNSARLPRVERDAVRHDVRAVLGLGSKAHARRAESSRSVSAFAAWDPSSFECQKCTAQIRSSLLANITTIVGYYEGATGVAMQLAISYRDEADAKGWVSANGLDAQGEVSTHNPVVTCQITGLDSLLYYTGLAHELFHCFQLQRIGSSKAAEETAAARGWVIEGGAAFAGCMASSGMSTDPANSYPDAFEGYLNTPELALFARAGAAGSGSSYSAMGFFSLAQQDGVNELQAALAAATAASDEGAYEAVVAGQGEHVLESWASSYFSEPLRGADWTLANAPCYRAGVAVPPAALSVSEHPQTLTAAPYTVADFEVANSATDVMHVQGEGTVRVEGKGTDVHPVHDSYFCTAEDGCSCPSGDEYTGPAMEDLPPTSPTPALAISGGPTGSTATVTGTMYKTFCTPVLSGPSCVGLLPGFSNELSEEVRQVLQGVAGKPVPVVTRTPYYYSSQCFFQYKGTTAVNAKGKTVFRGVIAVSVSVEAFSTSAAAISKFHDYVLAGYGALAGVGDEAAFDNIATETNSEGEQECASLGAVRVGDTIGQFSIGGAASEACGAPALALLSAVAGRL